MALDVRLLLKMLYRSVFKTRGTHARLTPKRLAVVLLFFPFLLFLAAIHLTGFILDDLLFSGYRKLAIKKPVFIVGVFRSGTTLLHRLLARDKVNFTSIRLWEIFFAPSITQKKLLLAVDALDRKLGGPARRALVALENYILRDLHQIHRLSLFEPEEDDGMLLIIFSSFFQFFALPYADAARPYIHFDDELPDADRKRIMEFYRRCLQRHLYVFGPEKTFLSKNPTFSPKVRSLKETFPDAQIICTVRSPLFVCPSTISMFSVLYRFLLSPTDPFPLRESTKDLLAHWFRYPVAQLEGLPSGEQKILRYDDLTKDSGQVVRELYGRFEIELSADYDAVLDRETEKARAYKSGHSYTLAQFDLDRDEILAEYRDVFERFGFNKGDKTSP